MTGPARVNRLEHALGESIDEVPFETAHALVPITWRGRTRWAKNASERSVNSPVSRSRP